MGFSELSFAACPDPEGVSNNADCSKAWMSSPNGPSELFCAEGCTNKGYTVLGAQAIGYGGGTLYSCRLNCADPAPAASVPTSTQTTTPTATTTTPTATTTTPATTMTTTSTTTTPTTPSRFPTSSLSGKHYSIRGDKITGVIREATVPGDKITGAISTATVPGANVRGVLYGGSGTTDPDRATIAGSQITGHITTATIPGANVTSAVAKATESVYLKCTNPSTLGFPIKATDVKVFELNGKQWIGIPILLPTPLAFKHAGGDICPGRYTIKAWCGDFEIRGECWQRNKSCSASISVKGKDGETLWTKSVADLPGINGYRFPMTVEGTWDSQSYGRNATITRIDFSVDNGGLLYNQYTTLNSRDPCTVSLTPEQLY